MGLTAPAHGPTGSVTPPLSTSDLAVYLGPNVTVDDRMQQPLTAAIHKVERLCGPIIGGQQTWQLVQSSGANRTIYPMWNMRQIDVPVPPSSLQSIDTLVDPYGLDVTDSLTVADVDWLGSVIVCPYQRRGDWGLTATWGRDAGEAEILKEASLIIAKALWERRRGQSARPQAYGADATPSSLPFAVPRDAHLLMQDLYLVVAG